jgi:iron complex transport system permease protein
LLLFLIVGSYFRLFTGEIEIRVADFQQIFKQGTVENLIVLHHRLPALLNAVFVGAGLSLAGYLMQIVFKNALAGPYILGVASGAGLLVAVFTLTGISGIVATMGLSVFAIIGAMGVSLLLLMLLAKIKQTTTILIIGVLISSISTAIISLLQFYSDNDKLKKFVIWTMGSTESSTLNQSVILAVCSLVVYALIWFNRKNINLLLLPTAKAFSLGLNVKKMQLLVLFLASVITGLSVAFCGPVGFVGIIVPHISAMLLKSRLIQFNEQYLFLIGANLVLYADLLAHLPNQSILPVNAILAVFGIPVIFYIVLRKKTVVL